MRAASLRTRAADLLGVARLRAWPGGRPALVATFAVAGLGDLGGNLFFVFAQQADLFSVAVVLASLYPVITTILAALLLHERLRGLQLVGVALATLSVVLLSNAFGL
jgi:drug/metabolite transporter (DMT)-like permease